MSNINYTLRVKKLQQQLSHNQLVILSNPVDVHYFSGFDILVPEEREAFLLVTPNTIVLQHAFFSPAEVTLSCQKIIGCQPTKLAETIQNIGEMESLNEILIDETSLFVYEYKVLQSTEIPLLALDRSLIWNVRMTKDPFEIRLITKAGKIASQAFNRVIGKNGQKLKPGITEIELKTQLEHKLLELGSEKVAFPTIVAFGSSGALPHHQPTQKKLEKNMPVLIDFGATVDGYRSDMTRSFWFGPNADEKFNQVEKIVHKAYQAATGKLDTTAQEIDQTARNLITEAGYGPHFIHTTGHGVGLDIHEQPSLNSQNQTSTQPGMVITIEPGIYLENQFGYRFENTVLITDNGFEELT